MGNVAFFKNNCQMYSNNFWLNHVLNADHKNSLCNSENMQGLPQYSIAVDLVYFWNYQYMIGSAYNAKITEEQVLRAIVKRGRAPPRLKKKGDLFL